jgi:hypothetical protein
LAAWAAAGPVGCWADGASADPSTAQLVVCGEHVLSLTLEDDAGQVVALVASEDAQTAIYRPAGAQSRSIVRKILLPPQGGTVSLAPGQYRWNSVIVAEPNNPLRFTATNRSDGKFTLSAGRTTALALGCPLRHRLGISRCGPVLSCTCRLLGVGGESYLPAAPLPGSEPSAQPKAPDLSVRQAGQEVHHGSFRYG